MKIKLKSKWKERRRDQYPDIAEQLDMLWHGMDTNPELRVEPFYSALREVKLSNPKVLTD